MSGWFKDVVHIFGIFYYHKTVLNVPRSNAVAATAKGSSAALSAELRRAMLKLKGEHMSEDGSRVDYDGMERSDGFSDYLMIAEQLAGMDLSTMGENERKALFINVYNTLVIHALIHGFVRKSYLGFALSRKMLYSTAAYKIGGEVYTLDEIEHGVLRGNALPVMATSPLFTKGDPRLQFAVQKDPRIHFALNCGAMSCPPISAYKAETIDRDLARASRNYLQTTQFKSENSKTEIVISKLLYWYRGDFGSTGREVLQWIQGNAAHDVSDRIKELLQQPDEAWKLSYQDYVWTVNSV